MTRPLRRFAQALEQRAKGVFRAGLHRALDGASAPVHPPRAIGSALLLRPDRLGDFVLTLPALSAFQKKTGPRCRTTLVVGERGEALARLFFPAWRLLVHRKNPLSQAALLVSLRARAYDVAVDFHSFPFSNTTSTWTLLSASPARVGFVEQRAGHPSGKIYNLGVPLCPEDLSERDKNWRLVSRLFPGLGRPPAPRLPALPAGTERRVGEFYRSAGIGPRDRVLGLHPTLGKTDNRWSQEKYLELLRTLSKRGRFKFVLVHGWGEGEALDRFRAMASRVKGVTALPETDLFFILGAARRFEGLVCNDSGLMHALSLVTRVAAVFGPSEPSRWGPIGAHAHRIFRAADRRCDSVRPADVARYVQNHWRGRPS